ncbi:hypothetical protein L218DRAFT_1080517 [Marasmius fiardii PR-910]|nr:hypothetical protein L218DRAFT_1080517 [Marasmius fiardii PR-910]
MLPMASMLTTLIAITFAHSYTFNPRRLEHFLYGPWSVILNKLISKHSSVLIPAPQYPIYVSSQSLPTSNDPDKTIPDSTAVGVYVDHAVILPHLSLLPQLKDSKSTGSTTLSAFLESISEPVVYDSHEWWPKVTIDTVEVPIMVELKRPPTRSPKTIGQFYRQLETLMRLATKQAMEQASCLFSCFTYRNQQQVILIAGAGNWWSCRLVTRKSKDLRRKAFNIDRYKPTDYRVGELDGDDGDDVDPEDELPEFAPPSLVKHSTKTLLARERAVRDKKREKQTQERAYRAQRRTKEAESRDQVSANLKKIFAQLDALDEKAEYPYTDESLCEYSRLRIKKDQEGEKAGKEFRFYYETEFNMAGFRSANMWSGLMRIGSDVSNKYMQYIEEELDRVVVKAMRSN